MTVTVFWSVEELKATAISDALAYDMRFKPEDLVPVFDNHGEKFLGFQATNTKGESK
jgi:hypothetical protein